MPQSNSQGQGFVDATICGVPLRRLRLMESRFPGKDTHTGKPFPAGTPIAFLGGNSLTEDQHRTIYPNAQPGKRYGITICWPMVEVAPMEEQATPEPEKAFVPSPYQNAIYQALVGTQDNILVDAKAGAAKSSTIVWALKKMKAEGHLEGKKLLALAFNKVIQVELSQKLNGTGVEVLTTHGFGYRAITKHFRTRKIDAQNGWVARNAFVRCLADDEGLKYNKESFLQVKKSKDYELFSGPVMQLVGLAKNWAIRPILTDFWEVTQQDRQQIEGFIADYSIDYEKELLTKKQLVDMAVRVLTRTLPNPDQVPTELDFDDLIWWPIVMNLPIPQYDFIAVDEAQDLNYAQQLMVQRLIEA